MPGRTHDYLPGEEYGCWTVVREVPPERKSWGLQRGVLARCKCGEERVVLTKMLQRRGAYCNVCNPGRKREKFYKPGEVYGPWTVLGEVEGYQYPSGYWARQIRVRCQCGEEVVVVPSQLRKSTQCRKCTRTIEIEVGQRFGSLVVLNPEIPGRKVRKALLRCDCGSEVEKIPGYLTSGNVNSCGCRKYRTGSANPKWKGHGRISGTKWKNYRNGAKLRGIPFKISISQAWDLFENQGKLCALTGRALQFGRGSKTTASLDRIDSSGPYALGNVQWVHKDINALKMALPEDRFIELCQAVADHSRGLLASDKQIGRPKSTE